MSVFVKDLNEFYKNCKPLYETDNEWRGFKWIVADDKQNNVVVFERYAQNGESLTCVCNFSGVDLNDYTINSKRGKYRVALNTDSKKYGGRGILKKRIFAAQRHGGDEYVLHLNVPKLTCLYLVKENQKRGEPIC